MESVLKQLAEELEGDVAVGKVYNSERDLFSRFRIKTIPTLIVFRNGEAKETFVGGRSMEALKKALEKYAP